MTNHTKHFLIDIDEWKMSEHRFVIKNGVACVVANKPEIVLDEPLELIQEKSVPVINLKQKCSLRRCDMQDAFLSELAYRIIAVPQNPEVVKYARYVYKIRDDLCLSREELAKEAGIEDPNFLFFLEQSYVLEKSCVRIEELSGSVRERIERALSVPYATFER